MQKIIKEILSLPEWTQVRLARELNVDPVTVNRWVAGRCEPTGQTLECIFVLHKRLKRLASYGQDVEYAVELTNPLTKERLTGTAIYTRDHPASSYNQPVFVVNLVGIDDPVTMSMQEAFGMYDMEQA